MTSLQLRSYHTRPVTARGAWARTVGCVVALVVWVVVVAMAASQVRL